MILNSRRMMILRVILKRKAQILIKIRVQRRARIRRRDVVVTSFEVES